jgi:threonine dehydratase
MVALPVDGPQPARDSYTGAVGLTASRLQELHERLAPYIRHTPLLPVPGGGQVKLESLQPTGSFKVRGFFAAALQLQPEELTRGLLTVSAGNAALACAHVARRLGVGCKVVMFDTAPALKRDGVLALGAEIISLPREELYQWMAERGWEREREVFIHPFADETVMAGHATLAAEILSDHPQVSRVLVPVGGGGLICGIAEGFAALSASVRVVGVQSSGYPLWPKAFAAGGAVALTLDTIADGTAAPFDAGMFSRLRALVHEWIVVPETQLRTAVARMAIQLKLVAEGSGALAFAAMNGEESRDGTVAVLSGGNIDPARLAGLLSEASAV